MDSEEQNKEIQNLFLSGLARNVVWPACHFLFQSGSLQTDDDCSLDVTADLLGIRERISA